MNGYLRNMRNSVAIVATCLALAAALAGAAKGKKKDAGEAAPAAAAATAPAAAPGAAAAPSPETSAPPSKSLERALKLYDRDDYYMGSILFDQVIDKKSGDDESNIQKAEFFMGKTLFNLRFYSASLSYFSKIVDKGALHCYY